MMAQPTRFGRVPKRKIIWEQSVDPKVPTNTKKSKKKRVETLEITPASDTAPAAVYDAVRQLPTHYTPPIRVQKSPIHVYWDEQEPLHLFLRFLGGPEALELLCNATNERAVTCIPLPQKARPWKPIHANELCHWLGLLLYMAKHNESTRKIY